MSHHAASPRPPDPSPQALVARLREILDSGDHPSENHRRAALRRALHEHAAGLTAAEIEDLIAAVRSRFPDRTFESQQAARSLAGQATELQRQLTAAERERDELKRKHTELRALMARLLQAASGEPEPPARVPNNLEPLVAVAAQLFAFVRAQDQTARSIEEVLGQAPSADAADLGALFARLQTGPPLTADERQAVGRRLQTLQLMPGALMTGAQQSWKGGTREVLERLDPKTVGSSVLGLRNYPAVLKAVEEGFQTFWNEFDRNVDHFYRGRFERVYRDKMEQGS